MSTVVFSSTARGGRDLETHDFMTMTDERGLRLDAWVFGG